jgi:hypothetical protein
VFFALALRREVPAVALDPLTRREAGRHVLPVGTLIDDAKRVIEQAEAAGLTQVRVRVLENDAWAGFELVDVATLRAALDLS